MSTKPLPLGPHQAYPNPPGSTIPYIPSPSNPWGGDPRQETTPATLPAPPPFIPVDSPYIPPALGEPVSDTSPVFVAAESAITSSYVKGPSTLGQAYPPGGILVEMPNPWDNHPSGAAQPVVIDGVPQIDLAGDPNSIMGSNPPAQWITETPVDNSQPEPPLAEGDPAITPVDSTVSGIPGDTTPPVQTNYPAVITDPTAAAVLDPNAAPAAVNSAPAVVTSGSAISIWWLVAIGITVWYFWFRKGKK